MHALPHAPQLRVSVPRLVQTPLHRDCPAGHWHVPLTHDCPPVHALPQRPQWTLLVASWLSQPFAIIPSQLAKPGRHAPSPHIPSAHVGEALGSEAHTRPQLPQLRGSSAMLVSHPSAGFMLQSANPGLHVLMPHIPREQPGDALAGVAQGALHAPQ